MWSTGINENQLRYEEEHVPYIALKIVLTIFKSPGLRSSPSLLINSFTLMQKHASPFLEMNLSCYFSLLQIESFFILEHSFLVFWKKEALLDPRTVVSVFKYHLIQSGSPKLSYLNLIACFLYHVFPFPCESDSIKYPSQGRMAPVSQVQATPDIGLFVSDLMADFNVR